jgi:hypothetical protein
MRLRRTVRRWRYAAIDWFREGDLQQRAAIGVLVVVAATVLAGVGVVALNPTTTSAPRTPSLDIGETHEGPPSQHTSFSNRVGGYGFAYPQTWNVTVSGSFSRLENPSGDVVLSFGVTLTDGLESATRRLVHSLIGTGGKGRVIGVDRQRIGGAPAFLRGGLTRDEIGRPIRYLAIAIDGDSRTYTLLVTAPADVDPERVLAPVEEIVTSFETANESFLVQDGPERK